MRSTITLEPVEEIPPDCRICHYDELGDDAKAQVPALADAPAETEIEDVDGSIADDFDDCDLVKYTEYYAVSAD